MITRIPTTLDRIQQLWYHSKAFDRKLRSGVVVNCNYRTGTPLWLNIVLTVFIFCCHEGCFPGLLLINSILNTGLVFIWSSLRLCSVTGRTATLLIHRRKTGPGYVSARLCCLQYEAGSLWVSMSKVIEKNICIEVPKRFLLYHLVVDSISM